MFRILAAYIGGHGLELQFKDQLSLK